MKAGCYLHESSNSRDVLVMLYRVTPNVIEDVLVILYLYRVTPNVSNTWSSPVGREFAASPSPYSRACFRILGE